MVPPNMARGCGVRVRPPNEAHSVDAPIALLFHIVRPWRRATDARRWPEGEKWIT
jgi:hypothetical protein